MRINLFLLSISLLIFGCSQDTQQDELIIHTVTGPIPVSEMGTTLVHEHIIVDFIGADQTGYHRWVKDEVVERAKPFLMDVKSRGLKTFFELTPSYLGRDPILFKRLSEETGLQIVTNTGFYGARQDQHIPAFAFEMSAEEIADIWIGEFENGIEDTGIKPGFLKMAVETDPVLSDFHTTLIHAAAITHLQTGLTIVSHTGPAGPAFAQIAELKKMGVSPEAFVWTHAQRGTVEDYLKYAESGGWISIDNVRDRPGRIEMFVERLSKLKDAGVLDQVLISHDSGWYRVGEENGGNYNGYTDLFDLLIPALFEVGFTQEDIDQLLIKNPQNAYGIRVRKL